MTTDSIKVLINNSDWAWPDAVRQIFKDRSVELLVVKQTDEALNVLQQRRIHTAIVDMDSKILNGLSMMKVIRGCYPLLPCILLTSAAGENMLSKALRLDVFSVIEKPVDMNILREQLHRLFLKKYNSDIFA